ncbi:MAG TPA: histidinol-phosphate transaminase [Thermoanaerobaculia bacterium]|nr:histidinol-phosphate transaminase [Thermoanaerobaculia bacterium]
MNANRFSRRDFARLLTASAAVAAIPRLALAKPVESVRLSANENPYGPSPAAMRAISDRLGTLNRYPDEIEEAFANDVAKLHGLTTDEVMLANGSSDVLRAAATAFLAPGKKLVTGDPTFEILWFHAQTLGADIVKVPLDAAFAHDVAKIADAAKNGAALIYICNPNNPTATITPKAAMRTLLAALPATTIVLVDEAYHHYAEGSDYESVAPLVRNYPNLIVARTFSKIYAMAGLRCGYGLANKELMRKLSSGQGFNAMNTLALAAARASITDADHIALGRKRNHDTRAWLTKELEALGYRSLPSEANFVMVELRRDAKPVITAMRERGVFPGRLFPGMPQHLRVTIGRAEEMEKFVEAFKAVVS